MVSWDCKAFSFFWLFTISHCCNAFLGSLEVMKWARTIALETLCSLELFHETIPLWLFVFDCQRFYSNSRMKNDRIIQRIFLSSAGGSSFGLNFSSLPCLIFSSYSFEGRHRPWRGEEGAYVVYVAMHATKLKRPTVKWSYNGCLRGKSPVRKLWQWNLSLKSKMGNFWWDAV